MQKTPEKLLLHVCCATCSGGIIERLVSSPLRVIPAQAGIQSTGNGPSALLSLDPRLRGDDESFYVERTWDLTVFFSNPNIHPNTEYEKRKADIKAFCTKLSVPFVDADYDPENWVARVRGLEDEPERGKRCEACFLMRLERTASYAAQNGFPVFATSLGISRWKNLDQVNACGAAAAAPHPGLRFWDSNWRKGGGADYRFDVAKREGFYQQKYCGCVFSKKAMEARLRLKE